MTYRVLAAMTVAVSLGGCASGGITALTYSDREQFSFLSSDRTEVMTYACASAGTPAETQRRASEAHRVMEEGIQSANAQYAGQLASGQSVFGAEFGARGQINARISQVAQRVEANYRCVFVGRRGA